MEDTAFYNDDVFQTMTITPRAFPQMDLLDVRGNRVDVNQLASNFHLILITLKNTTCPACPQLLKILNMYGLDPDCNDYIDPFTHQEFTIDSDRKRFFRLLLKHDAYFLVLCPGTNAQVGQIQEKTPFLDYPFISTEGGAVELVKALKVHLSDTEFMPAMLQVAANSLAVDSVYIGRGPGQYFHQYLLKRLVEARCKQEMNGIVCLRDAHEIMNQLKRKTIKCQQGKMASNWINLTRPLTAQHLSKSPTKRSPPPLLVGNESDESIVISSDYNEPMNDIDFNQSIINRLDDLPSEVLEIILDCLSNDVPSLVRASRTCRKFYIAICNVLITSIRRQMAILKPALPQQNNQVVWDETDVADESLDRWSIGQEGVPYRELFKRVSDARNLLIETSEWTRHWSPRSNSSSSSSSNNNNRGRFKQRK